MNSYFHVRKEDIHAGSARDVDPQFASFDVVLRRDYDDLVEMARAFAQHVLDCDTYGCENGPAKCLHGRASRVLDDLGALSEVENGQAHDGASE